MILQALQAKQCATVAREFKSRGRTMADYLETTRKHEHAKHETEKLKIEIHTLKSQIEVLQKAIMIPV